MVDLFAYIDPATTALIWQILAGVFVSLGVVFAIWWKKVTTFFKSIWVKIFGKKKGDEKIVERNEELSEINENDDAVSEEIDDEK